MRKVVERMRRRGLADTFDRWRNKVEEMMEAEVVLMHAARKWKGLQLGCALRTWSYNFLQGSISDWVDTTAAWYRYHAFASMRLWRRTIYAQYFTRDAGPQIFLARTSLRALREHARVQRRICRLSEAAIRKAQQDSEAANLRATRKAQEDAEAAKLAIRKAQQESEAANVRAQRARVDEEQYSSLQGQLSHLQDTVSDLSKEKHRSEEAANRAMEEQRQMHEQLVSINNERNEQTETIISLQQALKLEKDRAQKQAADKLNSEKEDYEAIIRQMKAEIAQKDEISRQLLEQVKKAMRRPG